MTPAEFVDAVRAEVLESAVESCHETLTNGPSGRRPAADLVELSNWYRSLPHKDQQMVHRVMSCTSHAAVFGMLCVIDGVRTVEPIGQKGDFELYYTRADERVRLNPEKGHLLHDLLNAE